MHKKKLSPHTESACRERMALIKTAMGENDLARFSEAVAFGENIAKGGTDLGAFLTCETLFATRGSFRWYICNHSWMSKEPAARNAAGQVARPPKRRVFAAIQRPLLQPESACSTWRRQWTATQAAKILPSVVQARPPPAVPYWRSSTASAPIPGSNSPRLQPSHHRLLHAPLASIY
jgi:hypothetical protein